MNEIKIVYNLRRLGKVQPFLETMVTSPSKKTQSQSAYARLKTEIERGTFPVGKRITEAEVARRLKVGRGPARESILRLEAEGMIQSAGPFCCRYVHYVEDRTPERLRREFEMREVLDGLAARNAALRMTGSQILKLRSQLAKACECVARQDRDGRIAALGEFYDTLRNECGNPLVTKACEAAGVVTLAIRTDETEAKFQASGIFADKRLPELAATVDAIASHDPEAAETKMRQWTRSVARIVCES